MRRAHVAEPRAPDGAQPPPLYRQPVVARFTVTTSRMDLTVPDVLHLFLEALGPPSSSEEDY